MKLPALAPAAGRRARRGAAQPSAPWRSRTASIAANRPSRPLPPRAREFGNPLLVRETVRDTWGWTSIEQWLAGPRLRAAAPCARRRRSPTAAVLTLGLGDRRQHGDVQRGPRRGPAAAAVRRPRIASWRSNELDLRGSRPQRASASWPNFLDWRRRTPDARIDGRPTTTPTSRSPATGPLAARARARSSRPRCSPPLACRRPWAAASSPPTSGPAPTSSSSATSSGGPILADRPDPVGTCAHRQRPQVDRSSASCPPRFVFPVTSPAPQLWVTVAEDARVESPDDTPMTSSAARTSSRWSAACAPMRRSTRRRPSSAAWRRRWPSEYPDDNANRGATVSLSSRRSLAMPRRPLLAAAGGGRLRAAHRLRQPRQPDDRARRGAPGRAGAAGGARRVARSRWSACCWRGRRAWRRSSAGCGVAGSPGGRSACWSVWRRRDVRGLDAVRIDGAVFTFTAAWRGAARVLVGIVPALPCHARRAAPGPERQPHRAPGAFAAALAERADRRRDRRRRACCSWPPRWSSAASARLARTDPGFDASDVTTMRVNLPDSRYPYAKQVAFYDRLLPELAGMPGVSRRRPGRPAAARRLALRHQLRAAWRRRAITRPSGRAPALRSSVPATSGRCASPSSGARVHGRRHRRARRASSSINESFAGRYFPGRIRSASGSSRG